MNAKVEEARRALAAAEEKATSAEAAHNADPSEESAATLARARRAVELARATLEKREAKATAEAAVSELEAKNRDARQAERTEARNVDTLRGDTSPALEAARARSATVARELKEAREALPAADVALDIAPDEATELRSRLDVLEARRTELDAQHTAAERAYADDPSDAAWSRVVAIRAERESIERELVAGRVLAEEAERALREAAAREQAQREAAEAARAAAVARETAERSLLPLLPKCDGSRVASALGVLMGATRSYFDALAGLYAAVCEHNATLTKARELAARAGRSTPEGELVDWQAILAAFNAFASRERGTRDTGGAERLLAMLPEGRPQGFLRVLFERAESRKVAA